MIQANTENGYLIRIPKEFGCYKFIDILGCGSTSIVGLVEDVNTGKRYSAKIISTTDIAQRKLTYSIEKEIAIIQEVYHPNIIKIRESFEIHNDKQDEFIVIIMEYCPKGDLLTLAVHHKIKKEEIKSILIGFLESIKYLHSRGISHGDIKSENILLGSNNRAKLCDFGYCRTTFIAGDESKNGTLYYAAPELFRKGQFDPFKSDIYAIGITLYSLFELQFPFKDGDQRYIIKQIVSGQLSFRSGINKQLKNLVLKCTDKDPINRPTIEEIINDEFFDVEGKKIASKDNNLAQLNLINHKLNQNSLLNQEKQRFVPQNLDSFESNLKI